MQPAKAMALCSVISGLLCACGAFVGGGPHATQSSRDLDLRGFLEEAFGSRNISADGHLVTGSAWFTGSGPGALTTFSHRFKGYCEGNGGTYRPVLSGDVEALALKTPVLGRERPLGYFQNPYYDRLLELLRNRPALYGRHEDAFRQAISQGAFGDVVCAGPAGAIRWAVRILPVEYQRTRRYTEGGAIIQAAVVDAIHQ